MGDISNRELVHVIESFFPRLASDVSMRPKLVELLAEVDQYKSGSLDFSDFVRLMRQFHDLEDCEHVAKEVAVIANTRFTAQEVIEFRELFLATGTTATGILTLDEVMGMISSICPLGDRNA